MYNVLALSATALIAMAVLSIGSGYLVSPVRMVRSFGLKLPATDVQTRAWLRLKGVRDVGCGLAVLLTMWLADRHSLGILVLALAMIPFGDMAVVLGSDGSKAKAFSIHGLTCAVMVAAGVFLSHTA